MSEIKRYEPVHLVKLKLEGKNGSKDHTILVEHNKRQNPNKDCTYLIVSEEETPEQVQDKIAAAMQAVLEESSCEKACVSFDNKMKEMTIENPESSHSVIKTLWPKEVA